jgi:hypothetical protein
MGRPARPPPPPQSASLHLNLRGLVLKFKVSVALSFFCCGFFCSDEVFYRYRFWLKTIEFGDFTIKNVNDFKIKFGYN